MSIKAGAVITCLYKRTPDLTFDIDYYQATHVPLATKYWESRGLIAAYSALPTDESEFTFCLTMFWESLKAWEDATKVEAEMADIVGDVKNFTNGMPTFVVGKTLSYWHGAGK